MTQTTDAALVGRLPDRLKMATQGPWMVQDGCSWRRIGTHEHDGDVLCPTVHPRDGHPDLVAHDGKLYANLMLIVDAVNALPGLLDTIEAQARRIEALEGAGQSLLDRAIMLATRCHEGQVDKGGQPYILHPLRVMLACQTEQERITAVLHDVMEDCDVSWATIARRFGDTIADAVAALTREEGESYASFIKRCATNPIARTVKMADLADNMDVRRLGREPTAEDGKRLHRYADARALLSKAPTP